MCRLFFFSPETLEILLKRFKMLIKKDFYNDDNTNSSPTLSPLLSNETKLQKVKNSYLNVCIYCETGNIVLRNSNYLEHVASMTH